MSQPGIIFSSFYPSGTADLLYLIVKVQNLLYADPFRALKLCAACATHFMHSGIADYVFSPASSSTD